LSAPEVGPLAAISSIPRDADGAIFPAPWAARAFALVVALNERGLFTWTEWADALGPEVVREAGDPADPETYWRAWLAALETLVRQKSLADRDDLTALQVAWRRAAESTPHGEPVELSRP
jgi:nitrile hydratase accessory protein